MCRAAPGAASRTALLLVLAAGMGGCSRCGRSASPPPERFLPADSPLTAVVPRLRAAQQEIASLSRTVLAFPAAAEHPDALGSLRARIGFDPLDPQVLEQAGLDPERGMGAAWSGREPPLLALPVASERRLEAAAAYLAREKLGAGLREHVRVGGVSVVTFRARAEAPAALALAVAQGTALLSLGPEGPARVAAAAALSSPGSLAASPAFLQARAALGEGHALFAFLPAGSPALASLPVAPAGAALGLSATDSSLTLRAALLLGARSATWREVLAGRREAGGDLSHVPPDAFLVLRFGGEPSALARALPRMPAGAAAALARAGLDLDRDLLALLAPGISASLSLAPTFEVAPVSRGGALAAARDPFRLVHLTAALEVKDPQRAAKALDQLVAAAPRLGLEVAPCTARGLRGWRIARGPAKVGLALEGKRLFVAAGSGRLEALLSHPDGSRYAAPSDTARAALRGDVLGGTLDFGQLVASLRALPPSAYGSGPDAFVMRSLVERIVEPSSHLLAASLRLDTVEGAARIELVIEARREPRQDGRARTAGEEGR